MSVRTDFRFLFERLPCSRFFASVSVPATSVIGLQWGDEAKGKIVDLLTERHDIVVRYQGDAIASYKYITLF